MRAVEFIVQLVVLFQLSLGARLNADEFRNEAIAIVNRIQEKRCRDQKYPVFQVYWVEGLAPPRLPLVERTRGDADACQSHGYPMKYEHSRKMIEKAVTEAYRAAIGQDSSRLVAVGIECPLMPCSTSDDDNIAIRCFIDTYKMADPEREATRYGVCHNTACKKCYCPPPCIAQPSFHAFNRYKNHRAWSLCYMESCNRMLKEYVEKGREKHRVVFDYTKKHENCLN